ncbi:hypothetical protein [Agromyces sp. H66]|uniref:hypothetical protein n=1 Tax=Agromyces sp. H66 TaxID=2529859 RepID=UPI0010AA2CE1|nr:hypothetical protein [Agromyces sp. H66]
MTARRLSAIPTVLFAALALAACTAAPDATPTPSAPATATPSPDATSEPQPAAEPAANCDTVLTQDAYAELATDGLEPLEPPAADHLATYYPVAAQMVEAGGPSCHWGKPQTDIGLTVTQATGVDLAVWATALADAGFTETNEPVPGAHTGPVDPGTGISPVVVVDGDRVTFVSAPDFATWIAPTP